jgi:protease-4
MESATMKKVLTAAVLGVVAASTPLFGQATTSAPATRAAIAAPAAKRAKVAVIRLTDGLLERPESFTLSLSSLTGGGGRGQALSSLIVTLNKAAKDSTVNGLFLDLSAFTLTLNQAQEIGGLLTNIRKSGKRVAVYASDYDLPTYVLASYADTVIMPENGTVLIPGVSLQMVFFKGTLDKLSLSADFVQVGKFKGAEEPFTRTSPSPEYKAQVEKLVDGMYTQVLKIIAANRPNMDEGEVKTVIDESWLSGRRAKAAGLVDQTMTRDRVDAWVQAQFPTGATLVPDYGKPKKQSVDFNNPFALLSMFAEDGKVKSREPAIAVIYAVGEITSDVVGGEDSTSSVTPGAIRHAVEAALKDDLVKAIVLRIDSPGGSASASDEIWAALKEADKKKPLTISMGRVAASGGYYIACAGRKITADPATITGSIGVVGGKIVAKDLLDKVGISIVPISRGQHAEMLSALRPFTEEERTFVQKSMAETYEVFTGRVTAARGEKIKNLADVAQGRLFTGEQAKEAGLVDDVGTLNDTIAGAAKNAGLGANYQIMVLPETKTIMDILREGFDADAAMPALGGVKSDALMTAVAALPVEVRGQTLSALRMLRTMEHEQVLLAMPAGLMETSGRAGR